MNRCEACPSRGDTCRAITTGHFRLCELVRQGHGDPVFVAWLSGEEPTPRVDAPPHHVPDAGKMVEPDRFPDCPYRGDKIGCGCNLEYRRCHAGRSERDDDGVTFTDCNRCQDVYARRKRFAEQCGK